MYQSPELCCAIAPLYCWWSSVHFPGTESKERLGTAVSSGLPRGAHVALLSLDTILLKRSPQASAHSILTTTLQTPLQTPQTPEVLAQWLNTGPQACIALFSGSPLPRSHCSSVGHSWTRGMEQLFLELRCWDLCVVVFSRASEENGLGANSSNTGMLNMNPT